MSLTQPRPEKKRKHAEAQAADGSASKKLKKDKKDKVKKDRKGKGRARHTEGEFKVVKASLSLSIAPVFANNPLAGAGEMLDSLVMRCVYSVPTTTAAGIDRVGTAAATCLHYRVCCYATPMRAFSARRL